MTICYLCGAANQELIRKKLRHDVQRNVLRCPSCGLVWLEPKQADLKEFYRAEYRQQYSPTVGQEISPEETFRMYEPFMAERIERVRPHLDRSMRVLEIGCATGYFLAALEPFVGERVGVEFNEAHAAYAGQRLGIDVYTDPIEKTDRAKGSFDVIFLFHVFEHMEDPEGFLRGLSEYLTPRGKVYIEVPNIDDALISPYQVSAYADFYYREPHLFYFSPATLRTLTERAGFMGEIEMIQRYSLANHIHWVTAGAPQADAETGMGIPKLRADHDEARTDFERELDGWLARVDHEYRALLQKHGRAEAMAFVGTMKETS